MVKSETTPTPSPRATIPGSNPTAEDSLVSLLSPAIANAAGSLNIDDVPNSRINLLFPHHQPPIFLPNSATMFHPFDSMTNRRHPAEDSRVMISRILDDAATICEMTPETSLSPHRHLRQQNNGGYHTRLRYKERETENDDPLQ